MANRIEQGLHGIGVMVTTLEDVIGYFERRMNEFDANGGALNDDKIEDVNIMYDAVQNEEYLNIKDWWAIFIALGQEI